MEKDIRLNAIENSPRPDGQVGSTVHVVDNRSQTDSSLLPMLIIGIVLIVVGMIVAVAIS